MYVNGRRSAARTPRPWCLMALESRCHRRLVTCDAAFSRCSVFLAQPLSTSAEVTSVTITSRTIVADGQSFGSTGPYERLVGRIEFALDPADPHNVGIVDLNHARRDSDGRVHFSSDLNVLRPSDPAKGNGVLLFHVSNRGVMDLLGTFNRGNASDGGIGDGLLMRDGYTMVFVGWEFDVPAPRLRIEAPAAILPAGSSADSLSVEIMVNERAAEAFLIDDPAGRPPATYPPAESSNPKDVLIVRDHFLETGTTIPRGPLAIRGWPERPAQDSAGWRLRPGPVLSGDVLRQRSSRRRCRPRRYP